MLLLLKPLLVTNCSVPEKSDMQFGTHVIEVVFKGSIETVIRNLIL
jgi:hypothetical protein